MKRIRKKVTVSKPGAIIDVEDLGGGKRVQMLSPLRCDKIRKYTPFYQNCSDMHLDLFEKAGGHF